MIVSKLNGKALYCKGGGEGFYVRATERNDDDESQHWIREGTNIVSKKLNKRIFRQPASTANLTLVDLNTTVKLIVDKKNFAFTIGMVSLYPHELIFEC